jgi:hypothetical protein
MHLDNDAKSHFIYQTCLTAKSGIEALSLQQRNEVQIQSALDIPSPAGENP